VVRRDDFLAAVYRNLANGHEVRAVTASEHLDRHPPRMTIELAPGSWGAGGDDGMWLNERTAWTWRRLWLLEDRFWNVAPLALALPEALPVLAQAARELLLAEASDWQFIITTGAVTDYAERRFTQHAADAELLVGVLEDASRGAVIPAQARGICDELQRRDSLFPDLLPRIAAALGRSGAGRDFLMAPRSVVLHGHFYQPPRENPWLGYVEAEATRHRSTTGTGRVEQECYRAVTAARIPDAFGSHRPHHQHARAISFDFAPPSWSGWRRRRRRPITRCWTRTAGAGSGSGSATRSPRPTIT